MVVSPGNPNAHFSCSRPTEARSRLVASAAWKRVLLSPLPHPYQPGAEDPKGSGGETSHRFARLFRSGPDGSFLPSHAASIVSSVALSDDPRSLIAPVVSA